MTSPEQRLRTHPKERLAASVQRINLREEAEQLRSEPHAPVAGHRQVALVRRGPVTLILFVFDTDGMLKEHQAAGEITIHVVRGRLTVTVADDVMELGAGELVSLAPGVPHSVRATEASEMLLTISQIPQESGSH